MSVLPHRYPMLLIDRVLEMEPRQRIVAIKNFTINEEFFAGHFPAAPGRSGRAAGRGDGAGGRHPADARRSGAREEAPALHVDRARALPASGRPRRPGALRGPGSAAEGEPLQAVSAGAGRRRGACGGRAALDDCRPGCRSDERPASAGGHRQHGQARRRRDRRSVRGDRPGGRRSAIGPRSAPTCRSTDRRSSGARIASIRSVCLGMDPQDLKFAGEPVRLEVGDRNTIREFTTFHRGTGKGGGLTTVGDDNLFMVYSHVAHDCHVGSRTIFANCATLAGHVEVGDDSVVGAFSAVQQFGRVGQSRLCRRLHAAARRRAALRQDGRAAPGGLRRQPDRSAAQGARRRAHPHHREGDAHLPALRTQHDARPSSGWRREFPGAPDVEYLIQFVRSAKRGVVKALPTHRGAGDTGGD